MEQKSLQFLIVDDDQLLLDLYRALLENAGHKVVSTTSSVEALKQIPTLQPDCVICDLTLPEIDGFGLFECILKIPDIKRPVFIIVTSKRYDFDFRRANVLGIEGFINKPINIEYFVDQVIKIFEDNMIVQFWGIRGTLPVPGVNTVRYGGNTNCVTLNIGIKHFFIFDAGTGFKALSTHLLKEHKLPISAKIFISHPHYDHINGIPFFAPFYIKGNEFEFFGSNHPGLTMEKMISEQMDSVYFPVTTKEFAAKVTFHSISEELFDINGITIRTLLLNHPGRCLGYRVDHKGKSFCYITDHELYLRDNPSYNKFDDDRLVNFIKNADLLIMDTTYTDEVYPTKVNWGHSCVSRVVDIAAEAEVKMLCLFHHDPDQFDDDIDAKVKKAVDLLNERGSKTICIAPREGDKIIL